MENQTKSLIKYLILPLLVAVVLVGYYSRQETRDWLLHVKFYDVGQGDSFLITTYQGNQVLVDGGPGDAVLQGLAQDMGVYDKTIEMVVLSHGHLDHFEGLISVLRKYKVEKVLMPNVQLSSEPYESFMQAVADEGAQVIHAVQGQRFYLDNATVLDVMYPKFSDAFKPGKNDDINDTSIVAMLRFGKSKILLTGDSGIGIEAELLPSFNLDADLLKVGHHGSKHSSSEEFLAEVTPEFAVIQAGEGNKYGHPTPEILDRLKAIEAQVFRNDTDGAVEFVSDGSGFSRK
jgi:competence protein ComEC